jgi:hypothetical protein
MIARRSPKPLMHSLCFVVACLLMLGYGVHLYAQDAEPLVEPQAILAAEATEAAEILPPTDIPATPEPTITVEPPTPEPPMPTEVPTELPTDLPVMLPTLDVTPQPALDTGLPAMIPSPVAPIEALPTLVTLPDVITATPVLPTPIPQIMPNLQLLPGPAAQRAGEAASVLLVGNALASVSSVALACSTDAALFQPSSATPNGLLVVAGTLLDSGIQPDGRWVLLWVRSLPDADSPTPTVLLQLAYTPLLGGSTPLTCDVTLGDQHGALLGTVRLEALLSAPPATTLEPATATAEPTLIATELPNLPEATETVLATATDESGVAPQATETLPAPETTESAISREATPELTETPDDRLIVLPEVIETVPVVEVSGRVVANTSEVVLVWTGETMQQQFSPEADGTFSLPLLAGNYVLRVTAPHHVVYEAAVRVEEGMSPAEIMLIDIDIDGNDVVDTRDVETLAAHFNQPVPTAPSRADLNGDGWVNLYDLAILGANIGS